jgi:hypothetical protein
MTIGLKPKTANPNHFKKLHENIYYAIFSLMSNELDEIIESKDYFSKCSNMLKPFDRIQIVKEEEQVVFEYIVTEVIQELNEVKVQKLSKIDLKAKKQQLFGYDISTKKIDEELKSLRSLIEGALTQKFEELDKELDEKIAAAVAPYLEEDETKED